MLSSLTAVNSPSARCRSKNSTGAWRPLPEPPGLPETLGRGWGRRKALEAVVLGLANTHPSGASSLRQQE